MLSAAFIAFLEFVLADALVKRELYQLHPKELGLLALTILICAAVSAGDAVGQGARPWHGNNRSGRGFVK